VSTSPGATTASATPPQTRDWTGASVTALVFLTLISSLNYLDRSILGLVLPMIKEEMQVSDTVLGLVSGLAFVLFYTMLGLPIAWAADRFSRRNIIAIGLAFWSAMTALTGFVSSIWQLALTRFLMGAGEASCLAPSQSMLADLFPPRSRSMAVAIFGTAFAIASLLYYPLIGMVSEAYGWRAAFIAAGVPGMVLAALFVIFVPEPKRGGSERAAPAPAASVPYRQALSYMARVRTYRCILGGVTFMGANAFAAGAWSPTFLERVHGMSIGEIANVIGPVRGILGMAGVLAGGWLADRLGRRDPRWRMWVPGLLCLVVAPAEALFLLADADVLWITGLALTSLFTFAHQGPIYAALLAVMPQRMRASAVAILILFSSLVSQALGPLTVGMMNDWLAPAYGEMAIRYSLSVVIICAVIAGLLFMSGARTYAEDAERAAGGSERGEAGKP